MGFRKRGLANGVSPFFPENATEKKTEESGKKTRKKWRKTEENARKRKITERRTEKIESDTVPATPFAKPRVPETSEFTKPPGSFEFVAFLLERATGKSLEFGSILGRDRGLVNNCSAAAGKAPNWTKQFLRKRPVSPHRRK